MVTPRQLDLWSSHMSDIYNSLEGEILRIIIKRLKRGKGDILEWQIEKLQELHLFNNEIAEYIATAVDVSQKEIEKMFGEVGGKIIEDVDSAVPYDNLSIPSDLDNIMRSYYNQAWSEIDNYVNQTLISTNYGYGSTTTRLYNDIINKTTAAFNTGMYTFDQALEKTAREWAQKGIRSTFIDKGGHTWSIERYVRTVLKSTLYNTYDKLRKDRMEEYGVYTVVVATHVGSRPACTRIQGNVVDLRPMDQLPENYPYRSVYDPYWKADYEQPSGHHGINCNHPHFVFVPGVSKNNQLKIDDELNKKVYQDRKKQRELERKIVKLKKNKMVSEAIGNKEGTQSWQRSISATQKRIRELVNQNEYLSRNYNREKVYTPLASLLKDFRYGEEG